MIPGEVLTMSVPGSLDEAVPGPWPTGGRGTRRSSRAGRACCRCLRLRFRVPRAAGGRGAALGELRGVTDAGGRAADRGQDHALPAHPRPARGRALRAARAGPARPRVADSRHPGTVAPSGGALVHARHRAGDLPRGGAGALDATLIARGPGRAEREIPAADLLRGLPDLEAWSLTRSSPGIRVPKLGAGWGFRYEKFHRTAQYMGDRRAWAARWFRRSSGLRRRGQDRAHQPWATTHRCGPRRRRPPRRAARASRDALPGRLRPPRGRGATSPPGDLHGAPDYRRHLARVPNRKGAGRGGRSLTLTMADG